jgi:DNA-binding NtrC family response regulator
MKIEVIECALRSSDESRTDQGDVVRTRIVADTGPALLAGLLARVNQSGGRLVLLTPDLQAIFKEGNNIFDVGVKKDSKALSDLFLSRQFARIESEKGKVLFQDATTIVEPDGLTKAVNAFLHSAKAMQADYLYLIVVSEKLFNGAVQGSHGRVEIDSRLPELEADIIGDSPAIHEVRRQILSAARHERVSVYVMGETGTGKTAIAWQIHKHSARFRCGNSRCSCAKDFKEHFVHANMGQIPLELFESELFGTSRGGQWLTDRPGLCEMADLGTLFLDEMHHMLATHQPKLLSFLDDMRVRRVNDPTHGKEVDVRVIFAAARDLDEMVRAREFLDELFARISRGMVIEMPPLRRRVDDIRLIAEKLWPQVWQRLSTPPEKKDPGLRTANVKSMPSLPGDVLDAFAAYAWPCNVRQLLGVLDKMAVRALDGRAPNVLDFYKDVGLKKYATPAARQAGDGRTKAVDDMLNKLDELRRKLLEVGSRAESGSERALRAEVRELIDHVGSLKKEEVVRTRPFVFRGLHGLEGKLSEAELLMDGLMAIEEGDDWMAALMERLDEAITLLRNLLNELQGTALSTSQTRQRPLHPSLLELREQLARHAHEVWMERRAKEGWRYGRERSDRAKTNPDMVPYDALSETEKEYDREMALGTIQALRALGFEVVRAGGE